MSRIEQRFASLKAEGRAALVTFIVAGDPDAEKSLQLLSALPDAGADIIELGMPFTDPMADGPAIQAADLRALANGMTLAKTLQMVRDFRAGNATTPIVLMGYYNPVYAYGAEKFAADAAAAGVDGLIIVDLPPEEDAELREPARRNGLDLIRLLTPTTVGERLNTVVEGASGFLYYVSVAGITGTKSADASAVAAQLKTIRAATDLPVVVGFGIRTPADVATMAAFADGVVVGSALVDEISSGGDLAAKVSGLAAALKTPRAA